MDDEVDEDGLPPAARCPECGAPMVPESFDGAGRIQVAFLCSLHGVGWTTDPFES